MVLPATLDPTGPLDDSMGVFYIGILISAVLYGLCLLQAFIYFQKFARDPWFIKAAVITLVTFDTTHLIFVVMGVYHYVISNFHHPNELQNLTWPILMEAAFVVANSNIVQVFYIYRVWLLCQNKIASIVLCGAFILLVCGETAWLIIAMKKEQWRDLFQIKPLATAILGLSCSIDVLIAGTLCVLLYLARTGLKRSDSMINRLILFIISTGSLTAIFAIVALICLFTFPYSLTYGALYQCIGYLYTNSFLTTLNQRSTVSSVIVDGTELRLTNIKFQEISTGKLGTSSDANEEAEPAGKTVSQRPGEFTATRGSGVNGDVAQQSHFFGDLA